jgi:hypothetical protein
MQAAGGAPIAAQIRGALFQPLMQQCLQSQVGCAFRGAGEIYFEARIILLAIVDAEDRFKTNGMRLAALGCVPAGFLRHVSDIRASNAGSSNHSPKPVARHRIQTRQHALADGRNF